MVLESSYFKQHLLRWFHLTVSCYSLTLVEFHKHLSVSYNRYLAKVHQNIREFVGIISGSINNLFVLTVEPLILCWLFFMHMRPLINYC